jgi:hypothetical protein
LERMEVMPLPGEQVRGVRLGIDRTRRVREAPRAGES